MDEGELQMSWLLFLDESGHDHKNTPYEIRGGIALRADRIWPFVRQMRNLEGSIFGEERHNFGIEIKGAKLPNRPRYRMARGIEPLDHEERRNLCLSLLRRQDNIPRGNELFAYAQANIELARGIFQILVDNEAKIFASAIPRGVIKEEDLFDEVLLRKDYVFLFERYFYFLERENQTGLIVMDETDKKQDKLFIKQIQKYFTSTQNGRYRSSRIVPLPFFVSSDLIYPIQAADVCIYCINWGFRLPFLGMSAEHRQEISDDFGSWLSRLQYRGDRTLDDGSTHNIYGIVFVPDPYSPRV
ncbi:MAG: DUF3800 domain-containing protein [bacterium]|nr:DUF3800 domain-containing protein [bacterium]